MEAGATWTATRATGTLGTSLAAFTLGGSSDTWGRTWSASNLGNAGFRVRVIDVSSSTSRDFFLDWVGVRVHAGVPAPPTLSAVGVSPATVYRWQPLDGDRDAAPPPRPPAGRWSHSSALNCGYSAGERDSGGGSHQRNVHGHHQYGHKLHAGDHRRRLRRRRAHRDPHGEPRARRHRACRR